MHFKYLLPLVLLLAIHPIQIHAQAKEAQSFDFTQILKGIDGKPITTSDAKGTVELTLGDAAVTALETSAPDDRTSGPDKFKYDELARKVYKSKKVILSIEEINLIKDRIGKIYTATVIGAAWRILDPTVVK